jgi:2-hydroxy-6-oxonona-2,4-dienedioate hydrolase
MALRKIIGMLSAAGSAATLLAYVRYREEMRAIQEKVESGSTIAETPAGPVEYAETGDGKPLLMIHGAGGGYDQGLLVARDFAEGFRVIAPSRFGYLKTPVPTDPSPAAQADAHAALLDFLSIGKCVVAGVSAGGPSAIELALRHPGKVSALVLLVPRTYDPTQTIGADESVQSKTVLRLVQSSVDFLFWLAMRAARPALVRFFGSLPELDAKASPQDRQRVTGVMKSALPLSRRVPGIGVDSTLELSPWPLDRIKVPVLIVTAKDDLWKTLPGARFTSEHIAGAELRVLESGGHLMIGQSKRVAKWVRDFLAAHREADRRLGRGKPARTEDLVAA